MDGLVAMEEPELDSNNESVIGMYDGIRKILSSQREAGQAKTREERFRSRSMRLFRGTPNTSYRTGESSKWMYSHGSSS